ncbi:MAG: ABC transporter permease, partial [Longimicrobiales bacterium]
PRLDEVTLDLRIAIYAIAVSALCGLVFGTVPALSLSSAGKRPVSDVRVTGGRARLQSGIVVAELAIATVLLVCAGLLTRTMLAFEQVDPGFRTDGVLTVRVAPSWARFADDTSGARLTAYMDEIAASVRTIPGVLDVAIAGTLPYSEDRASRVFEPEGYTPAPGEMVVGEERVVSWNYMDLMGMRIVRGRGFTEADDRPGSDPVIIVGEQLARHFWPAGNAIGRTIGFWDMTFRIVGVAAEVRDRDLAGAVAFQYYVPRRLRGQGAGSIVLRIEGDPAALAPAVRTRIWSVDPELPITSIVPLRDRMAESIAGHRYRMRLIGIFALLSAAFALLGVYGVTSRWVARRSRELGIRMALGAERPRVLARVLGRGVRLALIGAVAGIVVSLVVTRLLASFLFGVRPNDAVTLATIALLLAFMALLAAVAPARRATRVDPMAALRSD